MNRSRTPRWIIAAALFVFACSSPFVVPPAISTLDPSSLSTAIAGTAAAAAAGTASQGLQPAFPTSALGPILDAEGVNTAIALTSAAAGTQTAALIPPTLTPSVTPLPSQTPSITPSPTQTFIFTLPTLTRPPRVVVQKTPTKKGGGGGGGGGGGSVRHKPVYSCSYVFTYPPAGTVLAPNQAFQTVWRVRNTADDWLTNSADLVYVRGETFSGPLRVDFTSRVNGEEYANLPTINMRAPSVRGTYNATWNIQIGHTTFCSLPLNIIVQ